MRVLITGGAGFIGSALVRHIFSVTDDVEVTTLDALTYAGTRASLGSIDDGTSRHTFVHGDVTDTGLVDRLVAEADAVVHLAAESHVDRSIDTPATFLATNVLGAGVVFDACRRHQVARCLHVSTDEVYGPIEAPHLANEHDPLLPTSPYAASKAGADLLARSYARTYGYPITITRSANTFGPFQHPEKAVPRFIVRLLEGRSVPLYGDGEHVRDWTFVADTAAAQWRVLTAGEPGRTYNVAAGAPRTNRELVTALLARFGRGSEAIESVADRPGHDRRYAVDTTAVRTLGWTPATTFDDALDATVAWYRANEDWWRPLLDAAGDHRRGAI